MKGKILNNNEILKDDLFEGKPHKHLAKAIAQEIRSNQGCYIIGLDGEWGSGKSNLVGIIEKYLNKEIAVEVEPNIEATKSSPTEVETKTIREKTKESKIGETLNNKKDSSKKEYHFYTYDAWRHQTDSQRKAILKELYSYLTNKHEGSEPLID